MVSVIGFELAKRRAGQPSAVAELGIQLGQAIAAGLVVEPAAWLFLSAEPDVVLERIARRGGSVPFLVDADVIAYLDRLRRRFVDEYADPQRIAWVDNDDLALDEVVAVATRLVGGIADRRPRDALRRFLADVACAPERWLL
jgi:thymidylate kinase